MPKLRTLKNKRPFGNKLKQDTNGERNDVGKLLISIAQEIAYKILRAYIHRAVVISQVKGKGKGIKPESGFLIFI